MKNKEKFIDEIIDFACSEDSIAVDNQGEVVSCNSMASCENCKFYLEEVACETAIKRWLEEECVEPLVISRKDVRLLECIKDGYTYVARDLSGAIFLYINKPKKGSITWFSDRESLSIKRFDVCFPMVKWEDKEPWKIEDLRKLEVVENYETN